MATVVKCPNCGSTAQIQLIDCEVEAIHDRGDVDLTYRCGCGRGFVIRAPFKAEDGEMYVDEI